MYLPALFDKLLPSTTELTGTGTLDVYFEGFASEIGFFDVLGTLDLRWTGADGYEDDISYGDLRLDAKGIYDLLDTGYGQVKKALAPLDTVVDVLTLPVPGITQVSQLTGGPAVTLLDILSKLDPRIQLVAKLIEFQQLAPTCPAAAAPSWSAWATAWAAGSGWPRTPSSTTSARPPSRRARRRRAARSRCARPTRSTSARRPGSSRSASAQAAGATACR